MERPTFEQWNGKYLGQKRVDRMFDVLLTPESIEAIKGTGYGYVMSGDTMILALYDSDCDVIEFYDVMIRRQALLPNHPA